MNNYVFDNVSPPQAGGFLRVRGCGHNVLWNPPLNARGAEPVRAPGGSWTQKPILDYIVHGPGTRFTPLHDRLPKRGRPPRLKVSPVVVSPRGI